MTDIITLSLLRGAFMQLRDFCQNRPRPEGFVCDVSCPFVNVCGKYLEFDGLDEFADDMINAIRYYQGFSAKEEVKE